MPDSSSLSDNCTTATSRSDSDTTVVDDILLLPDYPPVNPGRLNTEWRTFFRNSLIAADPDRGPPTIAPPYGGTPVSLPPALRTATNDPSGDAFTPKTRDSFRLWSVNANGISSRDGYAELHTLCTSLQSGSVDAVALQEPNADFMNADIRQKYEEIFKEHFGHARVITTTTCISAPNSWKPGCVVLAVLGSWAQHVTKVSCGKLGRWASATLTGSDGDSITVYSVYNVVDVKLHDAGPSTVFSQQYRLLRLSGVTYPNSRQQFIDDLHQAIKQSDDNHESVVVGGDFNEALGKNPNLMASICSTHDLFDVQAHFHGTHAAIPAYARGSTRSDYCVASSSLEAFVAACSYNLLNKFIHSNHHAQFLDLNLKSFFGHTTPKLTRPDLRFVSSSSTDATKFIQKMHAHLTEHRAFHHYQEFRLDVDVLEEPWRQANKIDNIIGQAFQTGEKHCSKHPKPPVVRQTAPCELESSTLENSPHSERWTKVTQAMVLRNLAAELWPDDRPKIPRSTKILKNVGSAAQQALRHIHKNAVAEREKFLNELKAQLALRMSSKDADTAAAIKTIDRQLTSSSRFCRIARALKPQTSSALTKVEIVTSASHIHPRTGKEVAFRRIKVVYTRHALKAAIIARNKRHFAQASATPFTQEHFSRIGSDNGYNVYQDQDGQETRVPDSSFLETKTVMNLLRERHQANPIRWSDQVFFDEFISGLLHWNEKTSTSPSGRHLGLYGALVTAYCNQSGEFSDLSANMQTSTQEMAEQILTMIHGLAAAAASHGFFLRRWIQVVNVMIYKKPGCVELDKLRVIHLFEADLNLMIGILFEHRAMYHQVDRGLLNQAQFGRPGGECQDSSISKVLHNLISAFTHTPMGQFESDTMALFDREVMKFVLTCYHLTGAPLGPLRMWEQVLHNIVHKVKTGFGLSTDGYSFTTASPIHGPGQGLKGCPSSCSTMTSILIDGMPKLCHGIKFTDPQQQLEYTATVSMFIDDASNATNIFYPGCMNHLTSRSSLT
jgi:hypothetical protein